jgi:hypothetical protein
MGPMGQTGRSGTIPFPWRVVAPDRRTGPLGATALAGLKPGLLAEALAWKGWLSTTLKT